MIIFVGMHNKPNKAPLCSSTRSGKLIDKIINSSDLAPVECLKTNLYNIDYYPKNYQQKVELAFDWHNRIQYDFMNDIIVLLGAEVHEYFISTKLFNKIIKLAHPSSMRSHIEMNDYVIRAINLIKGKL
ncbi:MAG: hypothetical protein WCT77_10820 [Bacteroidota bacterium]